MGTTAEKLTYLNTTKGKIKDSINLTGAGITNQDTFRSYASKLKLGLIDIINNGIDQLYSNFPKVSEIGSNLSLTPTYEAPMRNLPLGNTYQQTYTGKNLLPYPYESTGTTVNGITFTPQSDGSVLVNGTATAQATFSLYGTSATTNQKELTGNYLYGGTSNVRLRAYNHSGSGYTNLGTDTGNGVQINKTTYTTGYIELVVPSGTTINNVVIKPMMLMNLDDTTYEPYVGGVPSPNPDYPQAIQSATGLQNITICGKNLFDKNNIKKINAYFDSEGGSITSSDYNRVFYIPCNSNTTYTITQGISTLSNHVLQIATTTEIPNINVIVSNYINYTSLTPQTYTTNATAKYLVFRIRSGDDVSSFWDGVQIEESLTATEYESYKGNIYEVNLGKNLFDINNSGGKTQCSFNITGNNLEITSTTTGNSYIYYDVPVKTSSTYNISCTAVADNVAYCYIRGYKTNGTYDTLLDFTDATNLNAHFNTDTDTSYLRIFLYATRVNSGGSSGNKTTYSNIQLEKGDIQTSYSPYFTPIELNKINTYQDSIKKSTGKNLFNKTNITSGKRLYYWQGTANLIDDSNYCVSDYINVNANSTYTINLTMSAYTRMIFFDNNKNPLSANETNATFTTPNNTAYVRLSVPLNQLDTTQLELGSQATTYEPYGKVWYVEKNINKKIFNGSNSDGTWAKQTGYYNCNANLGGIAGQGYTNYYSYGNLNTENKFLITTNAFRVNDSTDTLENYITWLNTHNIILYYVSNTPTYDTITNEELINQLDNLYTAKSQEGTTNISITSEYLPMLLSASALEMTD